jgi:ABC-type antimicrobial peptide transport system permease subunit
VPPYSVLPQVKAAALGVLPDTPLRQIRTLDEAMSRRIAQRRLNMLLLSLFGLLGLVISTAGIYGVMAYLVAQRTREIGIRVALGARPSQVVSLALRETLAPILTGLAAGCAVALALGQLAGSLLYGVSPNDLMTFVGAPIALAVIAIMAAWLPARRASRIDPAVVLRDG